MSNSESGNYRKQISRMNSRQLAVEKNALIARNLELNRIIKSFEVQKPETLQAANYKHFIMAEHNRTIADNKQKITQLNRAIKTVSAQIQFPIMFPNYI